jgi:hypothetical protein
MRYWNQVEDKFLRGIVLGSVCAYLGLALANVASPRLMENWEVAVAESSLGMNEVIYKIEGVAGDGRFWQISIEFLIYVMSFVNAHLGNKGTMNFDGNTIISRKSSLHKGVI